MQIEIDINKSTEENASSYFEKSKQAKKKSEGARKALEESEKKLMQLEIQINKKLETEKKQELTKSRKKEWYEKFRWFFTSEDLLVIGGRDSTTNEIIIKKYTDKEDLVFHTEMAGSPFVVIKCAESRPGKVSLEETAQFTACYSKAWKMGRTVSDVFSVMPDQVTKEAPSGEYISKGSFMIYGKKNQMITSLKLFVGRMDDGKVMAGPETAVAKHCKDFVQIVQGEDKTSSVAKKILAKLGDVELDDIIKVLPPGSTIKNQ